MDEQLEKQRRIEELKNESVLEYSCGPGNPYEWILPLAALLAFLLLVYLIVRNRRSGLTSALFVIAFFPSVLGVIAMLDGLVGGLGVIEESGTEPEPAMIAAFASRRCACCVTASDYRCRV